MSQTHFFKGLFPLPYLQITHLPTKIWFSTEIPKLPTTSLLLSSIENSWSCSYWLLFSIWHIWLLLLFFGFCDTVSLWFSSFLLASGSLVGSSLWFVSYLLVFLMILSWDAFSSYYTFPGTHLFPWLQLPSLDSLVHGSRPVFWALDMYHPLPTMHIHVDIFRGTSSLIFLKLKSPQISSPSVLSAQWMALSCLCQKQNNPCLLLSNIAFQWITKSCWFKFQNLSSFYLSSSSLPPPWFSHTISHQDYPP